MTVICKIMSIWSRFYIIYCFFVCTLQICCPSLAILLETQLSELDFTKEQLHILTSFLVPNEMQKHLESPFPTDEISSIARKAIPESELFDPIYDLFYPKDEIEGTYICTYVLTYEYFPGDIYG